MNDENSLTIRSNKNTNFGNTLLNHALDRFYNTDPTYTFWNSKKENDLFQKDIFLFLAVVSAVVFTPVVIKEAKNLADTLIACGTLFAGEKITETFATVYELITKSKSYAFVSKKYEKTDELLHNILKPIPGNYPEENPEVLYYSDKTTINSKEINAAWNGEPLVNYQELFDCNESQDELNSEIALESTIELQTETESLLDTYNVSQSDQELHLMTKLELISKINILTYINENLKEIQKNETSLINYNISLEIEILNLRKLLYSNCDKDDYSKFEEIVEFEETDELDEGINNNFGLDSKTIKKNFILSRKIKII